jgi:hypothetical protein
MAMNLATSEAVFESNFFGRRDFSTLRDYPRVISHFAAS